LALTISLIKRGDVDEQRTLRSEQDLAFLIVDLERDSDSRCTDVMSRRRVKHDMRILSGHHVSVAGHDKVRIESRRKVANE
jgi:hypothetical protein